MGITEDIFVRCQEILEEAAALLSGNRKTTTEEIMQRRQAANIAEKAAFVLLQKAFITPFDREDIWQFRQACECVWETAQEISLTEKTFLQGCVVCKDLALVAERLSHTGVIPLDSVFAIEQQLKFLPTSPLVRVFLQNAQQVVLCLQRLLLKSN